MSHNTFGHLFRVTTWGESHGPAIGCVVDGCPPLIPLTEADLQPWLDRRKPGGSRFVTQRQESDTARILSGVFDDGHGPAMRTIPTRPNTVCATIAAADAPRRARRRCGWRRGL
jgi:chorismate synthase